MANNQYVNKVVFGNETLIDLSSDTVAANKMLSGTIAHDKSGASVTGTIPIRTESDINVDVQISEFTNQTLLCLEIPSGYYQYPFSVGRSAIYMPIPKNGETNFRVYIPNGTLNPDKAVIEDWIQLDITVDSEGNSNVTDDTIPATGVSF